MHRTQGLLGQGAALVHHLGNAEVHHLHRAVFQHHHIVGLDVPVDNAPAVGVLQARGDLTGEVERLLPVESTLHFHILLQRDAVDELHDNVIGIVGGGDVKHLDNVGMAEHGNSLSLRLEAAEELLILGKFVLQNLHCHKTVQAVAAGLIHHRHASGADDLQELIPVVQQLSNILVHIQK